MSIRHRIAAVASAAAVCVAVVPGAAEANTAISSTTTYSCSAGGFTGWVKIAYSGVRLDNGAIVHRTIRQIDYKIYKGTNRGGNSANVYWTDGGTLPAKTASTGSGIQDNSWHRLLTTDYNRGSGQSSFKFVFDKSYATDPSCGKYAFFG